MAFETYTAECVECAIDKETRKSLCSVCLTQKVMRGKWKIVIIWLLRDKQMRFSEIQKSIPKITQSYLSNQLKDLESDKLIIRKSYNEIPPRVEYSLTEDGRNFIKVIHFINAWGAEYGARQQNEM